MKLLCSNFHQYIIICVYISLTLSTDIDQLTKILTLVGSPAEKLLAKISSEEVRLWSFTMFLLYIILNPLHAGIQNGRLESLSASL